MEPKKIIEELEPVLAKLDEVGDDEAAIQAVVEGALGTGSGSEELGENDLDNVVGGITEWGVLQWLCKNTKLGKLSWNGLKVAARCLYDYAKTGNAYKTYSRSYVSSLSSELAEAIPGWMIKIASIGSW